MKWLLVSTSPPLVEAWRRYFECLEQVEIIRGDICHVKCDAVVSPANSFGFMDGGLDLALSRRFGRDVQRRLQRVIRCLPARELLVGQAVLVPTEDRITPWIISAPTMRVPAPITGTVNAYLAMKAILSTALDAQCEPPIRSVAVPGLGTGVGRLDPRTAAHQMHAAFREIILGEEAFPSDLYAAAVTEHRMLHADAFDEAEQTGPDLDDGQGRA